MEAADDAKRKAELAAARAALASRIPIDQFFELPGRPTVVFQAKDYTANKAEGRALARGDVPFLFRAFEAGQAPPPRPGTKKAEQPRAATIHEYLDWTVTSSTAEEEDELDFGGFRVVTLLPRFRPAWPPPGAYDKPVPRRSTAMGAPRDPLPQLLTAGKPICAATIRVGLGYLEVPFFATAEAKRNRGYGRALLEAIEDVARCLEIPLILLCSTDDPVTRATWLRLGFCFTSEEDLRRFAVGPRDLLHMDNTVQMHKMVPAPRLWKSIIVRHGHWAQRLYYDPNPGDTSCAAQNQLQDQHAIERQRQQQERQRAAQQRQKEPVQQQRQQQWQQQQQPPGWQPLHADANGGLVNGAAASAEPAAALPPPLLGSMAVAKPIANPASASRQAG